MTPFLQLAFALAVILFAAKLAGYLSSRLGQPSVLGELLVGLALGPSLIDLTHLPFISDPHLLNEVLVQIGELGVLVLMFIAGLELHFSELARNTKVSALAGTLGVVFPVGLGYLVGQAFGMEPEPSIFLGLILGATSVSISAQTLMELGALRSRVGLGLLGAAVFDDILVILILSAFLALAEGSGGFSAILLVFLRMIAFLALSAGFGLWILPRLARRVAQLPITQGVLSLALVIMLVYGLAAEIIGGMAAITGTFLAGLMFARSPEKSRLEAGMLSLAYGFFVPIFFVSIGLAIDLTTLQPSALLLLLVVFAAATLGKIVGAGVGARLGGFTDKEAIQLGAGMVSRGEVGLIVASIGISQGMVTSEEFSAAVGMVLLTTIITPPMLRWLFTRPEPTPAPKAKPLEPAKTKEASDVHDPVRPQ